MSDTLLSISQAAKKLGVAAVTLRLWERQGKIQSLRTGGNQRRYSSAMLEEFMGRKSPTSFVQAPVSKPQIFQPQDLTSDFHHQTLSMPLFAPIQKQVLAWVVFVIAVALSGFGIYKSFTSDSGSVLNWVKGPQASSTQHLASGNGSVLAAETVNDDYRFVVNVPSLFNKNITAPNIIYGLTAGNNITITGGQNPTISTNDQTTNLKIFNSIKVGSETISAGSNTDSFELVAGSNIGLSVSDKKITIANSYSAPDTGWEKSGSIVKLSTAGNLVSIGTATGAAKLSVDNDTTADIFTASQSGNLMAKLDYNGQFNLAATGFNAGLKLQNSSTLFSALGAPNDANGANGDYYFRTDAPSGNLSMYTKVGGTWIVAGGASTTLQDAYDAGQTITTAANPVSIIGDFRLNNLNSGLLYVNSTGVVSRVANGSVDQMMVMSGGVPSWTSNPGAGGTGVFGYWQRAAGALSPANTTDDFLVGGTSTSSAKFAVVSGSGNITSAGTLTLPNSNTLTGQAGNLQFSQGISVGGGTTYYINNSGNANFNSLNAATTTLGGTTVTSLLDSGSASVSGGLILYGVTTISTTGMQSLNLGDSSTGNIVTSHNISATGTLTGLTGLTVASGTVSLPAGQIDSTELVGTDIATVGTITSGIWNSTAIGPLYGGTGQTSWTTGDLLYASGTNTLAKRGIGSAGQVLTVSGGLPTWTDTTSVGNWQRGDGIVAPLNITDDVLVGATSTASAKIALNASSGLLTTTLFKLSTSPVAGYVLVSDASGNGSWTDVVTGGNAGAWTLSGSSLFPDVATYNVLVGSATTSDDIGKLTVSGAKTGKALVVLNETGDQDILTASASGVTKFVLDRTGTITTGIWNATTIADDYGGTGQSTYTTGDLLYASGTNTLAKLGIGSTSQVLTVSGGVPSWGAGASSSNWQRNAGAIAPLNITDDLLVGGISTASAKFTVVSSTGNTGISGTLTLPNSNTQTGVSGYNQFSAGISVGGGTTYYINNLGTANLNAVTVNSTLAVTGATTLTGALTANSTASISGALTLFGTPTLQSTANQTLILGGDTTGNITLSPLNSIAGGKVNPGADNLVSLGSSPSARFKDLFLGPASLHIQSVSGDAGYPTLGLDWAQGINTSGSLVTSLNGTTNALMAITQSGNVGIGDSTPSKLFVVGNGDLFQVDSSGNVLAPTLALGTGTIARTDRLFDINTSTAITNLATYTGTTQRTLTGTLTGDIIDYGIFNALTIGADDGSFSHESRGIQNNLVLNSGYTIDTMRGIYGAVLSNSATISPSGGANTATTSAGITYDVYNNAAGTITNQYGGIFSSFNNSTGSVTNSFGSYNQSYNANATGTIAAAYGNYGAVLTTVDGASITSAFGSRGAVNELATQTTGGITNAYGGYFVSQDATNTYGLYAQGIQNTANTETFSNLYGILGDCQTNSSSVTVTNCSAIQGRVIETAGTISTGAAGYFESAAAMATGYGVYSTLTGASTNSYGLYSNVTGAGTTNYGLYSNVSGAGTNYAGIFMGGNVGIGTTGPDARLDALATSGEQLRLTYTDGSVYTGFTVDSSGNLVVNNSGTNTTFSDKVGVGTTALVNEFNVAGAATVSSSLALGPQSTAPTTCNAANEGRIYYSGTTGTKRLYVCDGTNWIPVSAGSLAGGSTIDTISPEYPSAVISADGSNNTGTFTSDREATGSGSLYNFNYYEFASAQTSLQDYDIYVRFRIPENFSSWVTSNALTIDYETEDTTNTNNKVDVTIYQDNDADTVTSLTNVSNYANTWHSSQTGGTPINFTAAQLNTNLTWAAGSIMTIKIKLYSKDNYFARVGSIKFDWQ